VQLPLVLIAGASVVESRVVGTGLAVPDLAAEVVLIVGVALFTSTLTFIVTVL
jgi:hypothetical protein